MDTRNEFCEYYQGLLNGKYDCVDRIIMNAYFIRAQTPGGLRCWWRDLMGNDDTLDNTHLMRFAGRFSRRVRAFTQEKGIPLIDSQGERKHDIAETLIPHDPNFRGVFCILFGRAPAPVFDVHQFPNGAIDIRKKTPKPFVNHYSFHIMDPDWGHITIKLCPHPPFNAQIMLNGHEYVAIQAGRQNIHFTKEDNCFTVMDNAAGLAQIADTMKADSFVGRLVQVCERWLYSTCLCFALELNEQQKCGFHYSYSVYQGEYSRNLLFKCGHTLDQVLNGIIDRNRSRLDIQIVKTILGWKHRPKKTRGKRPRLEVVVEKPVYDLTVLRIHFGKLTIRMYSKGEHVLRIEVVVHNTTDLRLGKVIDRFPRIIESLAAILERFLQVLQNVDVAFIDVGTMDAWPLPSQVGACQVGGIDINRPRIRAAMKAVMSLSPQQRGFTAAQMAYKMKEITGDSRYQPRQAAYDLKKLRGKCLVSCLDHSRRYQATSEGLRSMSAFLILREKAIVPLLSGMAKPVIGPQPLNRSKMDIHYRNIQIEMQSIFQSLNIAA